ncbi:cilia- and flagella-associated protein 68-like [Antedon mediterranea]|uniref:cilia- and flagella-associated protein 68-like n=1 Tax=Antedon mediterranea TaxID=105859 RepID=UPI003AF8D1FA
MDREEVSFRSMIRASGLGEVWTHTTDVDKFKQYGWRCTTKENCYSPQTLVGNWNERRFDIEKVRVPKQLPSQYDHYFDTTYDASYEKEQKPVPKELLHLANRAPRAYNTAQPELDPPRLREEYQSFQTTSRAAYVNPKLRQQTCTNEAFAGKPSL